MCGILGRDILKIVSSPTCESLLAPWRLCWVADRRECTDGGVLSWVLQMAHQRSMPTHRVAYESVLRVESIEAWFCLFRH